MNVMLASSPKIVYESAQREADAESVSGGTGKNKLNRRSISN